MTDAQSPSALPKEVSRGIVRIGPVEVEVIQLDDGRRLISAESLAKLLDWMGHDTGPIAAACESEENAAG